MSIKDYLHLYLGCKCHRMGEVDENDKPIVSTLTGISYDDTQRIWWAYFENNESGYSVVEDVFPILRPLSDITNEEVCKMNELVNKPTNGEPYPHTTKWARRVCYMLERHFDLFKLIEAGLAIDKTSLQQPLK
jgi:hypothetical protein